MATPELALGEEYDFDDVHIWGVWENGECRTYMSHNGHIREFVLEIEDDGRHLDHLEYENQIPQDERELALRAIHAFGRLKRPDIITTEDPRGNLI